MNYKDSINLKKRYLIWFYKVTKDELDRIERKFTQAELDRFILKELKSLDKPGLAAKQIREFQAYVVNKEKDGLALKYDGKDLKADYYFLDLKLQAIEKAIVKEFGKRELVRIKALYEKEMTERILKSTEHK
ncbi:MAG: hypothetical protein NTY47_04800 [Candidatus Omnitrophica bacterium]|nr:hypothetical protein [Candidatus Omnitrophota bacterium]